ncbi:MAG: hypothetical protein Kilf2KO_01190 [Rhodospirillales bacterium]
MARVRRLAEIDRIESLAGERIDPAAAEESQGLPVESVAEQDLRIAAGGYDSSSHLQRASA